MPKPPVTGILHQGAEVRISHDETRYRLGWNLLATLVEVYKNDEGITHPHGLEFRIQRISKRGTVKWVEEIFDRDVVGYMLTSGKLKPYEEFTK